ncbi:MAG: carboxylating nicotinate-nucleotide diphosphorylase [Pseudanabaenaceae cyanobacterium bins.68]|nr:carboxylating nicotinate-nucleotide diphosphorylase [Pseudanabaenaceae cyanobacterium bins.68]
MLPIILDPLLDSWLREDLGRGDRTTDSLYPEQTSAPGHAYWVAKAAGVIAGLAIAERVFQRLEPQASLVSLLPEGTLCHAGQKIAELRASYPTLLMGERVALNLAMRLSGIATLTHTYKAAIADLPAQLVDTRKTTPGLRLLEKYATQVGGAINHRFGLDEAVMLKDNHIAAAGGITKAVNLVRSRIPLTIAIEVETENLDQVAEAASLDLQIIMLDNMPLETMRQAIPIIRHHSPHTKIEASGNISLDNIRAVAEIGVDYISTSAMVTRSPWLDLSMRIS